MTCSVLIQFAGEAVLISSKPLARATQTCGRLKYSGSGIVGDHRKEFL
jgi:hypothetical protein